MNETICRPDTNLAAAVELLWVNNRGMLPVVGNDGKLEAVITDRDICIATGTRNRLPSELTVKEVATKNAITCEPDVEIHEALLTMAEKQVRRLPVVNPAGVPQGILSMDDIIPWRYGEMAGLLRALFGRNYPHLETALRPASFRTCARPRRSGVNPLLCTLPCGPGPTAVNHATNRSGSERVITPVGESFPAAHLQSRRRHPAVQFVSVLFRFPTVFTDSRR
jgi:CBS domain protein